MRDAKDQETDDKIHWNSAREAQQPTAGDPVVKRRAIAHLPFDLRQQQLQGTIKS